MESQHNLRKTVDTKRQKPPSWKNKTGVKYELFCYYREDCFKKVANEADNDRKHPFCKGDDDMIQHLIDQAEPFVSFWYNFAQHQECDNNPCDKVDNAQNSAAPNKEYGNAIRLRDRDGDLFHDNLLWYERADKLIGL